MPIKHPDPTSATVKKLYHHAIRCAYPRCTNPLYKPDKASGQVILNSHVCHINARREGGPRWDFRQSGEENRSEANRILMCVEHAGTIDDPAAIAMYPAHLLRTWKAEQISEHARLNTGWQITDDMAQQVANVSFSNVETALHNSPVHLGGRGGGPGRGGGGGGALGRGARAGDGGRGGDQINFTPDELEQPDGPRLVTERLPDGRPPGAGGGGTGAIGEGAIAGNGGDGGSIGIGRFDLTDPAFANLDRIEVQVGEGGRAGWLPGQHGLPGSASAIRFIGKGGETLKVVSVPGGQGGRTGAYLPPGVVEVSKQDIDAGFRITTLLPVNSAESKNGLLYMLGAGWTRCPLPVLPWDLVWTVVVAAAWPESLGDVPKGVFLTLSNPDMTELARVPLFILAIFAKERGAHWVAQIGAHCTKAGRWTLRVVTAEGPLMEVQIDVQNSSATEA